MSFWVFFSRISFYLRKIKSEGISYSPTPVWFQSSLFSRSFSIRALLSGNSMYFVINCLILFLICLSSNNNILNYGDNILIILFIRFYLILYLLYIMWHLVNWTTSGLSTRTLLVFLDIKIPDNLLRII